MLAAVAFPIALFLILLGAAVLIFLTVFLVKWGIQAMMNTTKTQRNVTDAELIKLLDGQPDGLLSPHQLAELTGMTVSQARRRFSAFHVAGMLHSSYNNRARSFYGLKVPYSEPPNLELSPDPFLTVEDMLQLFDAYGGRLTVQDMLLATKLPLAVLMREMKHFEKEGVVQQLTSTTAAYSGVTSKFFVLQEPYRSDPGAFQARAGEVDLELRTILRAEDLIV